MVLFKPDTSTLQLFVLKEDIDREVLFDHLNSFIVDFYVNISNKYLEEKIASTANILCLKKMNQDLRF